LKIHFLGFFLLFTIGLEFSRVRGFSGWDLCPALPMDQHNWLRQRRESIVQAL
jgi:hypothetical protein